jgi:hypothetical protein
MFRRESVADTEEKLKPKAFQQKVKRPAFSPKTRQSKHSSTLAKDRLKKMIQHSSDGSATPTAPLPRPRLHFLSDSMRYIVSFLIALIIAGGTLAKDRLKKMIQHSSEGSDTPVAPSSRPQPYFMSDRTRRIVSFFIVLIIGGGLAAYLRLFPTPSVPSTQTSEAIIIRQVSKTPSPQAQIPTATPTPQQPPTPTPVPQREPTPTPTPAPQQTPNPTPPAISPAIPAGKLLYSTSHPFSACDNQGGHWTDASGAKITCNPDGSEMTNTSGHLAVVNLDQLGGNQSPWPSQSFIVQMQVTINPNSAGAFGIDFQPETDDNTPGYFAYLLSPPSNWAFSYCTQGIPTSTLIAAPLLSPVSTKFTLDIRVEGTSYAFYINGTDTTGLAVTGPQFINKIVGLVVGADADITFSNLAIYALP